jgi:hypothetical protein
MLTQEPWCFHPDQIATLTDWQIEELYARPAIKRNKKWDEERADFEMNRPKPTADPEYSSEWPDGMNRYRTMNNPTEHEDGCQFEVGSPEFREWVISQFMAFGLSRRNAEAQYEAQAKSGE